MGAAGLGRGTGRGRGAERGAEESRGAIATSASRRCRAPPSQRSRRAARGEGDSRPESRGRAPAASPHVPTRGGGDRWKRRCTTSDRDRIPDAAGGSSSRMEAPNGVDTLRTGSRMRGLPLAAWACATTGARSSDTPLPDSVPITVKRAEALNTMDAEDPPPGVRAGIPRRKPCIARVRAFRRRAVSPVIGRMDGMAARGVADGASFSTSPLRGLVELRERLTPTGVRRRLVHLSDRPATPTSFTRAISRSPRHRRHRGLALGFGSARRGSARPIRILQRASSRGVP